MKGSRHLTIVIKIGTSSIVDEKTHEPILSILSLIVEAACLLRRDGHRVIIVSSGAIGTGLRRMNIAKRPKHLAQVQALAAIGQCKLLSIWDTLFAYRNQPVAQILLTRNDIADRTQYLNAQSTIAEVLSMGVIPIVNENDTLAVTEIKFGDNDTLSAITAAMVSADYLFLMTDVDCLYDQNPRKFPDAKPIEVVHDIDSLRVDVSSAGSALGTGGMATKIIAARLATSAGTCTIITNSSKPGNLYDIINYLHPPTLKSIKSPNTNTNSKNSTTTDLSGSTITASPSSATPSNPPPLHTRFIPSTNPIRSRAFWIMHGLAPHGTLYIDRGAAGALSNKAGLLPVGIVAVEGNFAQQEAVRLVVVDKTSLGALNPSESSNTKSMQLIMKGEEIGRAVVNYSATEVARIKGMRSSEIRAVLGYADTEYVAFRENVSLKGVERSRPATPNRGDGLVSMSGSGILSGITGGGGGEGGNGGGSNGGSGLRTPVMDSTPEGSIADLRIGQ